LLLLLPKLDLGQKNVLVSISTLTFQGHIASTLQRPTVRFCYYICSVEELAQFGLHLLRIAILIDQLFNKCFQNSIEPIDFQVMIFKNYLVTI